MKPYDSLTIIRNRARARDLRIFRDRVRQFFEQFEYDAEDLPVDWEGARAARAEINRMLPRVIQIVEAAELSASSMVSTGNPAGRAVDILHHIFSRRYAHGGYQEILDIIDMAVGVYDANQAAAWMRTINPLHYVLTALGWIGGLPLRGLVAIGLVRSSRARVNPDHVARLEAAVARLASTEELIESRFAEMRELQSRLLGQSRAQIEDIAERLDFAERVLAQQGHPQRKIEPGEKESTPV